MTKSEIVVGILACLTAVLGAVIMVFFLTVMAAAGAGAQNNIYRP
jgi:hypothetical protein